MERNANWKAHVNAIHSDSPLHANIQKQLCPTEDDMEVTVPTIDLHALRAIACLRNPELSFAEEDISSELIELSINAIRSSATTSEEQALGFFTRRKLKRLATWDEWQSGETKQLNQFRDLWIFW